MNQRALALVLLAGCAHDVSAVYPMAQPNSGTVEIVLNDASRALSVTIDDALVVDRQRSRRALIAGVPAGPARVHVASGGGCEQRATSDHDVVVPAGGTVTVALPGPENSLGCSVLVGLGYVAVEVGFVGLAILNGRRLQLR